MNTDKLTADTIAGFIPNILTEVEGERSLFDKLAPFLESARLYLESEFLGHDDFLSEVHNDLALKILVAKAFADAVPSLDLIVTPTGMGVINTDNMAPASKERVERLIAYLRDYVRSKDSVLVDVCRRYEQWRSGFGRKFCDIFLYEPDGQNVLPGVHYEFDYVRSCCIAIEDSMAEHFLGRSLMVALRHGYHSGSLKPAEMDIINAIRVAEIALMGEAERYGGHIADQTRLWFYCRNILAALNYSPEYKEIWEADKGKYFNAPDFKNDIKGSFFF